MNFKIDDEIIIVTTEFDKYHEIKDIFRTEKITSVTDEYIETTQNKYNLRDYEPISEGLVDWTSFICKSMRNYNDYILRKEVGHYLTFGVSYRFSPKVLEEIVHEREN